MTLKSPEAYTHILGIPVMDSDGDGFLDADEELSPQIQTMQKTYPPPFPTPMFLLMVMAMIKTGI